MITELEQDYRRVLDYVNTHFSKKPDTNAILFLIGVRELGILPEKKFSKTDKVGLLHIAVCKLLSYDGYYALIGMDNDGWPHWDKIKELPFINIFEQELLLKQYIVHYFIEEEILPSNEISKI